MNLGVTAIDIDLSKKIFDRIHVVLQKEHVSTHHKAPCKPFHKLLGSILLNKV